MRWMLIFWTIFAVFVTPFSGNAEDGHEVDLAISLTEFEVSKDSNKQKYEIRIQGHDLTYSGPIGKGERGRFMHGTGTLTLTDEQLTKLLRGIREKWTTSFTEKKSLDGHGHFAQLEAQIELDGVKIDVIIEGATTSRNETSNLLSEDARSMVGDASFLASQLKRLIDQPE
jgi:hypothetical protein